MIYKISEKEFKVRSNRYKDRFYSVTFIKGEWYCDCWWYANRTIPNKDKWGYCSHIRKAIEYNEFSNSTLIEIDKSLYDVELFLEEL